MGEPCWSAPSLTVVFFCHGSGSAYPPALSQAIFAPFGRGADPLGDRCQARVARYISRSSAHELCTIRYAAVYMANDSICQARQFFSPCQVVSPEAVARVVACQTPPLQQLELFILSFSLEECATTKCESSKPTTFGPLLPAPPRIIGAFDEKVPRFLFGYKCTVGTPRGKCKTRENVPLENVPLLPR